MNLVRSAAARLQALFNWWIADIRRRPSLIGKAGSLLIGLFVICCVCSLPFSLVSRNQPPTASAPTSAPAEAAAVVAAATSAPVATVAPEPTAVPAPTSPPTAVPPTSTPALPTEVPTPEPTATPEPPTAPPSFDDQVRNAISPVLTNGNRDLERISTIEAKEGGQIYIQWTINDNLTEGLIKAGAKLDLVKILQAIHDAGLSYNRIITEGSFSLVDTLGNAKEVIVVHSEYPRELIDKINWQNFRMDNVYVVGENVKLHRLFQD